MHQLRSAALALSAAVLLAGCNGSDDEPQADEPTSAPSQSVGADGKPVKQKRNEPWTVSAGEPMTNKQVNYLAVCVQWDGYQDGVRWDDGIWENAYDSGNKLALEAVESMSRDLQENGEPTEATTEMMEEVCADVDR